MIFDYIKNIGFNFNQDGIWQHVEISSITNTLRFKLKYDGFVCAYVVGKFNDWKKNSKYKLTWKNDSNNGEYILTADVTLPEDIKDGRYNYKYILIDEAGNEVWLNKLSLTEPRFSFVWKKNKPNLVIKSSSNTITYKKPIELVAIYSEPYCLGRVIDVKWSLDKKIKGVYLENQYLYVNNKVKAGKVITVKAYDYNSKLVAEKKIIVSNNIEKGALVHFFQKEGLYNGEDFSWNYWTFGKYDIGREVNFNIDTDLGKASYIINDKVIVRKKLWGFGWENSWAEQTNCYDLDTHNKDYYIIHGDNYMYISLRDAFIATDPKIETAIMDDEDTIKAYLSHDSIIGVNYNLYINGICVKNTISTIAGKEVIITNIPKSIIPTDLLEVRASAIFKSCKVTMRNYLNRFYYDGNDMGITFTDKNIRLRVWAPTAYKCEALIYNFNDQQEFKPNSVYEMKLDIKNGTHQVTIDRIENEDRYFLYRLYFKDSYKDGVIIDKVTYAVDPYSNAVGVNGDKGVLMDIESPTTKPIGWNHDKRPILIAHEDSILYEMHIRDFTIDETSGVTKNLRGKYLGAVESGTFYKDENTGKIVKTGIDHLKELGITHVHLLPVFDFGSVDETRHSSNINRNWGYDPKNYNVPEGSYATDPYDPAIRIREFREMIKKFHENNIRVIMDVVYNHSFEMINMNNLVPGYYFRTDQCGKVTNGSGCGNEIASERPMIRKFIVESSLHWIKDYNIDGLRFDLMELIDLSTITEVTKKSQEIDSSILIYGEPWKADWSPLLSGTYKGCQRENNFSIFNDNFRDAIRGDNGPSWGFINGDQHNIARAWNVIEGIKGSINGLTVYPKESINYVDAHDNYTLWDQVEKSLNPNLKQGEYRSNIPNNPLDNYNVRQTLLGIGIILTSQGIPFFQGGSEMLRTKQGDHNSYRSKDEVNAFHWNDKILFEDVFNYYKGLINLRNNHPAFKMKTALDIRANQHVYFTKGDEKSGVIISHIRNNANDDPWNSIVVIYNSSTIDNYDINGSIPASKSGFWNIVVNSNKAGVDIIETVKEGNVPGLRSHSMMVIYE